ncbi:MAG TPA: hypothetical protein VMK12_01990 [Anaeromyxobacteraceae bacterium]|nr:hypothetical protein [Anaeromyxobacteraceae bacterium]
MGLYSPTAEHLLWVVGVVPLFVVFAIINLGWWLVARRTPPAADTRKRWPARVLVVVVWVLGYVIDDVHQRGWAENCPPGPHSDLR